MPSERSEDPAALVRRADDKERLIGFVAAPFAAAIGILVVSALTAADPPALLHGTANPKHVAVSTYHDLLAVLAALSVAILASALTRRRIPLGISMALFGLAVFNLHYWGFGIPFVMAAAWLLVRSYREKRALTESVPGQLGPRRSVASSPASARPPASRRYTPPSGARRRRLA